MVITRQSQCSYNAFLYLFNGECSREMCQCFLFFLRAAVHCNIHSGKFDELIFIPLKWDYVILLSGFSLCTFSLTSCVCCFIIFFTCNIFDRPCCVLLLLSPVCSQSSCVSIEGARGGSDGVRESSRGQKRFTAGLHSIYQDFNRSATP